MNYLLYFTRIPGFTNKTITNNIRKATTTIIFKHVIKPPKLKPNPPLKKSAIPLPIFGFSRIGFTFGSSCASPTGDALASRIGIICNPILIRPYKYFHHTLKKKIYTLSFPGKFECANGISFD